MPSRSWDVALLSNLDAEMHKFLPDAKQVFGGQAWEFWRRIDIEFKAARGISGGKSNGCKCSLVDDETDPLKEKNRPLH